ncbi:GH25 family lysozyme [Carnobacterium divergens]|uniref:GH25 family lysozyme n=1 Tax=Carnobacterium divergens TaxID=2748 RepID=UPI0039C9AC88
MYLVKIYSDGNRSNPTVIHDGYYEWPKIISGKIVHKINETDSFTFSLNINHPAFNTFEPFLTHVECFDLKTGISMFYGRVRELSKKMTGFEQTIVCEDVLNYLFDSFQEFEEMGNASIDSYFRNLIAQHNKVVEPYKRFDVRLVNVTNNTDNVYRGKGWAITADTIKDKLVSRLGGYLISHREGTKMSLSYLSDIGSKQENPTIEIAKNLMDISKKLNPDKIFSRLIPTGADIEGEHGEEGNENDSDINRPKITIKDVNNGVPYLDDTELIKKIGIVPHCESWSNINDPNILKTKARKMIEEQKKFITSWSINMADLSFTHDDVNQISVGNHYKIICPQITENEYVRCIEKEIDIIHPQLTKLTMGDTIKSFTDVQTDRIRQEKEYREKINNSVGTIESLKNQQTDFRDQLAKEKQWREELEKKVKELEEQIKPPEPTEQKGTDVSEHNTSIDWAKLKATGHTFVMVRGGYGQTTYDKLADRHTTGASAQGLKLGLYWFSYAKNVSEAIQEANKACDFADKYKGKFIYPIAWDWENDSERYVISQGVTPTKQLVSDMAIAFCNRVSERGYKPMNYSNLDYYNKYFDDRVKKYDWWLARPGVSQPDVPCTIWQNELDVDGTSRGINGNADFDISFKNY